MKSSLLAWGPKCRRCDWSPKAANIRNVGANDRTDSIVVHETIFIKVKRQAHQDGAPAAVFFGDSVLAQDVDVEFFDELPADIAV